MNKTPVAIMPTKFNRAMGTPRTDQKFDSRYATAFDPGYVLGTKCQYRELNRNRGGKLARSERFGVRILLGA